MVELADCVGWLGVSAGAVLLDDEDRPKVLARGPRCVPFSSIIDVRMALVVDIVVFCNRYAPLLRLLERAI